MDALGRAGDKGQEGLGRRHMGIAGQAMMLDRPDGVEAHFLGQQALLDHVLEDLGFVLARDIDHLRFINNRKLHPSRAPPDDAVVEFMAYYFGRFAPKISAAWAESLYSLA